MDTPFIDPRTRPRSSPRPLSRPPAADSKAVAPFVHAINKGRLYEAEQWIADGNPLQFVYPANRRKSPLSPLQAALRTGQHDALHLLLCNGYRTDLERFSPFTEALQARRHDLIYLLLDWHADPTTVDADEAVRCYDIELLETLWKRGVDLTRDNALSGAVAHATSNRQLYGFLKRHAHEDPALQRALNRGLGFAIESPLPNQDPGRAVALCIWAGADPWAAVPWSFEPVDDQEEPEKEKWSPNRCAAGLVVGCRHVELLDALKLDPDHPRFQRLYEAAEGGAAYTALARLRPPTDPSRVANLALKRLVYDFGGTIWSVVNLLETLFKSGGRLLAVDDMGCHGVQRYLGTKNPAYGDSLIRLLQDPAHVEEAAFLAIIHSPRIIRQWREFRITRQSLQKLAALPTTSKSVATEIRRALRPKPRSRGPSWSA